MRKKLTVSEVNKSLGKLQDWEKSKGRDSIEKEFIFKDFQIAFDWMTEIALVAEKMDHHPEWLNVYNKINVTLSTHDSNGITQLDVDLAKEMDRISKTIK